MNDIFIRIILSTVAGLTYFAGAIPAEMQLSELSSLPLSIWVYFLINTLTGFYSPSMVKKTVGIK